MGDFSKELSYRGISKSRVTGNTSGTIAVQVKA
jgi:hypothetical protein